MSKEREKKVNNNFFKKKSKEIMNMGWAFEFLVKSPATLQTESNPPLAATTYMYANHFQSNEALIQWLLFYGHHLLQFPSQQK